MNVQREMLFPRKYEVEILDELSSGTQPTRLYFPGASERGGSDGLLIEVHPQDAPAWQGVFASADRSETLLHGIFSSPEEDVLCVVSGGNGYFVHADKPQWWSEVKVVPITRVLQLVELDLMIFADFTSLTAWAKNGLVWRTKQLAWDDLQITSFDGRRLFGRGFDPISSSNIPFSVDVRTGEHEGGSSPEAYEQEVIREPRPKS